jgi:hypothetical protein
MPTKAMFTLAKFIVIMLATVTSDTYHSSCLGHLGWRNIDRIVSISCLLPKVAMARTYYVAVANIFTKITLPM